MNKGKLKTEAETPGPQGIMEDFKVQGINRLLVQSRVKEGSLAI